MHLPQKTVLQADFEIKSWFREINLITPISHTLVPALAIKTSTSFHKKFCYTAFASLLPFTSLLSLIEHYAKHNTQLLFWTCHV